MKKILQSEKFSFFIKATLFFNILVFLLTILDFLALHDIAKDYLSKEALDTAGITAFVPAWTATEGEWLVVQISFFVRVTFLLVNLIFLWVLLRSKISKEDS